MSSRTTLFGSSSQSAKNELPAMSDAYAVIDALVAEIRQGVTIDVRSVVLRVLELQGILPRRDDGVHQQTTISVAQSAEHAYVIGLRYDKRDGSQTEDLFAVEPGKPIVPYYKGRLQGIWPEYAGTHKRTVDYGNAPDFAGHPTMVNTAAYPHVGDKGRDDG